MDNVNAVSDPVPVKLSTVLSLISKVGKLFATRFPQKISVTNGATENMITLSKSIPNPFVGLVVSCGCCITPFTDNVSCAALVICALVPLS